MIDLSDEQKDIIEAPGHLLVLGGPGSGKTTVAILKADRAYRNLLCHGQKALFLSFARATVARVLEVVREHSSQTKETIKHIDVETYHSFFWRIIRAHGYLIGLPRKLSILAPPAEAIALSEIRNDYGAEKNLSEDEKAEKADRVKGELKRIAFEEGQICFDLFAEFAGELLNRSTKVRGLVSSAFPVVILDEFQDTSVEQWEIVKLLGIDSTLISLADPEQRIFEFIGADPERIDHYRVAFSPKEFDLSDANYRSAGTDIARFGNELLKGEFSDTTYKGVDLLTYPSNQNQAFSALKGQTLQARKRLIDRRESEWSLAILVPTKKMMRQVSDVFREAQPSMPKIGHRAVIDMEGTILAAELIAFLLQPKLASHDVNEFVGLLCNFFLGKGGGTPTKKDIAESQSIRRALQRAIKCKKTGKELPSNSIIRPILAGYKESRSIEFSGDPVKDWITVRAALESSGCKRLEQVAAEARNIRLLDRGTQLREALSQSWRDNGEYANALEIVRQAFVQEHFSTSMRPESGVIVMNMHKAKGKQFDEVIIFEGWPRTYRGEIKANFDRIVRNNSRDQDLTQARLNFRVSVTRAKTRTTIMTPENDPCVLLSG